MKKSKTLGIVVALLFMVSVLAGTVSAATVSTTEFGTFSYDLTKTFESGTRSGFVIVNAYTGISVPKSTSTVYVTMDIRDNSTGALYQTLTDSNATYASKTFNYDTGLRDLGVFACHEARGTTSVVRYTSCVV